MGPDGARRTNVARVERPAQNVGVGVGSPGRRRACVVLGAVAFHLGVDCGREDFAGLGIIETVDREHAVERARHVQPPPGVERLVSGCTIIAVDRVRDPGDDAEQLSRLHMARHPDPLPFELTDRRGPFLRVGVCDHLCMRARDVTSSERFGDFGQRLELARQLNVTARHSRCHPARSPQCSGRAQVPVDAPVVGSFVLSDLA